MFVIRPRGNLTADVIGDISNELNAELEAEFIWTDPLDFTNVVSIYQDRRVRVGAMQGLCQHLNDLGYPTRIELPELEPAPFNWEFYGELRPLQDRLPRAAQLHRYGFLCAPPGCGKCLGIDTPILMYDGTIKPVQDVEVGDLLMGPDSQPRRVKSLARGREEMFRITPVKGDSFTCNRSHILSLKVSAINTDTSLKNRFGKEIVNISVDEYLQLPKYVQDKLKLYRTPVDFGQVSSIELDPYLIGLWLGDGSSGRSSITTMDPEIKSWLYDYAEQHGYLVRTENHNTGKATTYIFRKGARAKNDFRYFASKIGLRNKHIPTNYKLSSREDRLQLLAGLLDADGHLCYANGYDIISKYQQLAEDIVFVSRSLGFAAYLTPCRKRCVNTNVWGDYYRVSISGDTHIIPVKLPRKQATARRQIKSVLVTGMKVESIGEGDYYGFEIEGPDRLFLLGDFTVTHNTVVISKIVTELKLRTLILAQAKEPFFGAYETLQQFTNCNPGRLGAGFSEPSDVTVCLVQTVNNRIQCEDNNDVFIELIKNAEVIITDEAHNCMTERYSAIYENAKKVKFFLGTTATPFASDDRETLLYSRIGPILAEITHAEAIDHNLCVPFTLYYQDCPGMKQYKDKDPRLFQYGSVYSKYITYNKERCNQYLNFVQNCLDNDLTCAIIVSKIKHGKTFKKLMPELTEVYGSTSDKARKQAWADLQSRKIKCVVTTLMDEATNIPSLDAVAIAAGGKSKTRLIQRLRNLRTFDGETEDGWYTKERGYVYITIDDAPYVGTHSKINLKNLKALANAHPLNEVIKV